MQQDTLTIIFASIIAICITSALDANGYGAFSAFILIPLFLGFSLLGKLNRKQLGIVVGSKSSYLLAVVLPLIGVSTLTVLAFLGDGIDISENDWTDTLVNISLATSIGILMVMLTEEGFFRGLLWSLSARVGNHNYYTLWLTTGIFVLWHLSAITLVEEYAPPLIQVPIYLANATLLGLIWGLMRLVSCSIWPPAIYHSIWNGLVYELFGFGTRTGDLGVEQTWLYGPEIGLLGVIVNGTVCLYLYNRARGLLISSPAHPT